MFKPPQHAFLIIGCLTLALVPLLGDDRVKPAEPGNTSPNVQRRPCESLDDFSTRQLLARKIPSIDYENKPLEEVVEDLRKRLNISIHAHWSCLSAAAIEKDAEVNLRLQNISGERLLHILLETSGGGETELAYFIDGGTVHITTLEDASRFTSECIYDCGDLLNVEHSAMERHMADVFRAAVAYTGRDLASNSVEVERLVRVAYQESRTALRAELSSAIQKSIDPHSWAEAGGNTGSISFFGDRLVVVQNHINQAKVADFLEGLRTRKIGTVNSKQP